MEITDLKKMEAPFMAQVGAHKLQFRQRLFTTDEARKLDEERVGLAAEWTALRVDTAKQARTLSDEETARIDAVETRLREIAAESFVQRIVEWPFRHDGQPVPLTLENVNTHFGSDPQYLANIVGWADVTRYPKPATGNS